MHGEGTSHDSMKNENTPDSKSSSKKTAKDKDQEKDQDKFEAFTSDKVKQLPKDKDGPSIVPPSKLFDKKTIEKFAKKGPDASKGLSFDTSGFKHRGYMRMLKERIESLWKYPKGAARLRHSGALRIKFVIKRDGTLDSVNLLKTSGYNSLDEAAMKALEKASPYWPLPEDWEGDSLEITGHFIYVYGVTNVM
jgi:protein TonB